MTMYQRARAAWGADLPDWVEALAVACDRERQGVVARRIGYSAAVVSQALSGQYKGDWSAVETAVRGGLMDEAVECPILGEIGREQCRRNQRQPKSSARSDPVRRALLVTCPTCRHRLGAPAATPGSSSLSPPGLTRGPTAQGGDPPC